MRLGISIGFGTNRMLIGFTAGAGGTLTFSGVTSTTITVNWTKATPAVNQASYRYYVYRSTANNIGSVANAESNGTLLNSGGTLDINNYNDSGLSAGIEYWYNVVVEYGGNKVAYTQNNQATPSEGIGSMAIETDFEVG